jgi:hypothetical protein
MHSNVSIPPIIHPNSSTQTNESNLSSVSSGISGEKRQRDEDNSDYKPQRNQGNKHLTPAQKKHREEEYERRRNKGIASHFRRQEMMTRSSEYCIFHVSTLFCREHVQKTIFGEGVYCGLIGCKPHAHLRSAERMDPGLFYVLKERIVNHRTQFLYGWDRLARMDRRGTNHLYTILDHVHPPIEFRRQLNRLEDNYRTGNPMVGSITQPQSVAVRDALKHSGKLNVNWREKLCSTQSMEKKSTCITKPKSNPNELGIAKSAPNDKADSDINITKAQSSGKELDKEIAHKSIASRQNDDLNAEQENMELVMFDEETIGKKPRLELCSTHSRNDKPTLNTKPTSNTNLSGIYKAVDNHKIRSDHKSSSNTQPDSNINITKAQSSAKETKSTASKKLSKEVLKTIATKTKYTGDDKSMKSGKDYDKTDKFGKDYYLIRQEFGSKDHLNIEPTSNSDDKESINTKKKDNEKEIVEMCKELKGNDNRSAAERNMLDDNMQMMIINKEILGENSTKESSNTKKKDNDKESSNTKKKDTEKDIVEICSELEGNNDKGIAEGKKLGENSTKESSNTKKKDNEKDIIEICSELERENDKSVTEGKRPRLIDDVLPLITQCLPDGYNEIMYKYKSHERNVICFYSDIKLGESYVDNHKDIIYNVTSSQLNKNKKAGIKSKKLILDILESMRKQEQEDSGDVDNDDDDSFFNDDQPDYFRLMAEKQVQQELTQFNDNLCYFTPLMYQFTAPGYPNERLGHCPCSKHYSQWHRQIFKIKKKDELHDLSSEKKPNCDKILSAQQVYDHCKDNTGCHFHQSVYQYLKHLYGGKNGCIKRVPSDWKKGNIAFHYNGDNKKRGNQNKSNVAKSKEGNKKKSKKPR